MRHDRCYAECDRPGTIHIGENGNPDTEWICSFHRDLWGEVERVSSIAHATGSKSFRT
jgi:hypothetical protein